MKPPLLIAQPFAPSLFGLISPSDRPNTMYNNLNLSRYGMLEVSIKAKLPSMFNLSSAAAFLLASSLFVCYPIISAIVGNAAEHLSGAVGIKPQLGQRSTFWVQLNATTAI